MKNSIHTAHVTEADSALLKRHPQLKDKAIVDWINGLEVTRDHLQARQKDEGLLERTFSFITGATERRQQHIDQNLHAGLSAAFSGLQDLQLHAALSDLAIELIADKLTETRAGLMKLQAKMSGQFADIWQAIGEIQAAYGPRIKSLELRTERLEKLDLVDSHIALVLSKWESGQYETFSPLERLFVACNELQWGDFGDFQRELSLQAQPSTRCERMMATVHNNLVAQLRRDCGSSDFPPPIADWLKVQQHREAQDNQMLIDCLTADYQTVTNAPLPLILADRSNALAFNSLHLPRSAGPEKMVRYMLSQTVLTKAQLG